MKGVVIKYSANFGATIKVEGKDYDYIADKKVLEKGGIPNPEIGQEIFFQEGKQKGNQVKVSKILSEDILNQEDFFEKVAFPQRSNAQFLDGNQPFSNPYNFVPVAEIPKDKFEERIAKFKKPYVPHDRFDGLSGIITCRLKTLSPFFISGTHKEMERDEHKHLDFFSTDKEKINGQENRWRMPVVAGSTLRGVIRSVCEAVSNSPITALSSEVLDYRALSQARNLKCGRIIKLPSETVMGEIQLLNSAKLAFADIPSDATDTMEGWARIEDDINLQGQLVGEVAVDCTIENPNDNQYKRGYFKLTGRNLIDKKKNERFFYVKGNETVSFSLEEMRMYNKLIKRQNTQAEKAFKSDNSNIAAKEIRDRKNHPLAKGLLVYFQKTGKYARNLGYVSIPRWQYEMAIHEKIGTFFHPAEDADSLCPTSRIFGFVRDKKISKKKDYEGKSSYAGRIYFSDAKFDSSHGKKVRYDEDIVLDILGSPKPTTYEFYLFNPADKNQSGNYNNTNMKLRGRKFYLHQENKGQYRRKGNLTDQQNSTLKKVLAEGNEFVFTVRFDNLEDYELGLLLWSLALENGMAHKIGMGKPLGFGSVSITVGSVEIICRKTRYSSFVKAINDLQDGITKNTNWQNDYVLKFTSWMEDVFTTEFAELENVKALKKILEYPNRSTSPIHYPLCENTDEKQFEWFVANRRSRNPQVLPFPNRVDGVAELLKRNRKVK